MDKPFAEWLGSVWEKARRVGAIRILPDWNISRGMARVLFLGLAVLSLITVISMLLDDGVVGRLREPVFGPGAVHLNAALLLAVSIGYVYLSLSQATFRREMRFRVICLMLLHGATILVSGESSLALLAWVAFSFFGGCHEQDTEQQALPDAKPQLSRWRRVRRAPM